MHDDDSAIPVPGTVGRIRRRLLVAWRVMHALTALLAPWILYEGCFLDSTARTLADEARHAEAVAYIGAGISAVLLVSTLLLRRSGPSAAATFPFAVVWALGIAMWMALAADARASFPCRVELCMPGFGVFFFGFTAALVVSIAVVCSVLIRVVATVSRLRRSDADASSSGW